MGSDEEGVISPLKLLLALSSVLFFPSIQLVPTSIALPWLRSGSRVLQVTAFALQRNFSTTS